MPDKLTDNEIVKALECCTTNVASCKDCPAFVRVDRSNCKKYFRGAIELINRLQAENESWQAAYMTEKQEIANLEIELKAMRGAANSYKAENERLQNKLSTVRQDLVATIPIIKEELKTAKAEAYKECIEKVKKKAHTTSQNLLGKCWYELDSEILDNLLKELVGENNGL